MANLAPALEDRRSFGIGILLFAQIFFTGLDRCAKWMAMRERKLQKATIAAAVAD